MSLSASAQDAAPPSNETDEQRFVRLTRLIESLPIGDNKIAQAWLVGWAVETPDYGVTVCPMAGPEWDMKNELAAQLMVLAMVGNLSYQIEHGKDKDELSLQLAGTETALHIYAATVAKDPSKRLSFFDSLITRRDAGTLRDYLAPIVKAKCEGDVDKKTSDA